MNLDYAPFKPFDEVLSFSINADRVYRVDMLHAHTYAESWALSTELPESYAHGPCWTDLWLILAFRQVEKDVQPLLIAPYTLSHRQNSRK